MLSHLRPLAASELAAITGGSVGGPGTDRTFRITGPEDAGPDTFGFAFSARALGQLQAAGCGLIVAPGDLADRLAGHHHVLVEDARLALALVSRELEPEPAAWPDQPVKVPASCNVAPTAVIGTDVVLGEGCTVGPHVTIGAGASLGDGCVLHPGAHLYPGVRLGNRVTVHAGAVIGGDGFGYVPTPEGPVKIHHLGTVIVDDDAEIGVNACVDRGALGATVIGARTVLDNHVLVSHNTVIGPDCLIAGHTAIGGSVRIGRGVMIAGNSTLTDHIQIGDGARLGGMSGVSKDIPAGETWFGIPAMPLKKFSRRQYLLGRLEDMWSAVRERVRQ